MYLDIMFLTLSRKIEYNVLKRACFDLNSFVKTGAKIYIKRFMTEIGADPPAYPSEKSIFSKMIDGEIPADIVHKDEKWFSPFLFDFFYFLKIIVLH